MQSDAAGVVCCSVYGLLCLVGVLCSVLCVTHHMVTHSQALYGKPVQLAALYGTVATAPRLQPGQISRAWRVANGSSEQRQLLLLLGTRWTALSLNGIFLLHFKLHYQCISLVFSALQCIALLCST